MIRLASTQRLAVRCGKSPLSSTRTTRIAWKNGTIVRWQSALRLQPASAAVRLLDLFPQYAEPNLLCIPESRMLACSSVALSQQQNGILKRVMKHCKRFWQWLWEAFVVSTRSIEVTARFSPLLILTPVAVVSHQLVGSTRVSDAAWWYTLKTLQGLGPAWQKLGQWAATRRDLFPVHVCDRLGVLHDRGFAHSWNYTKSVLRESFGNDFEDKGLKVHELIGCGSAAQVYRGSLREEDGSTRKVAVKVLHPRFASLVERDLVLLKSIANLLHSLPIEYIRILNLPHVSENFTDILRKQADLRVEGHNLTMFRRNFYGPDGKNESKSLVVFAKPVDEWTTSNILVEDLIDQAKPIADYIQDSSEEGLKIRKELAGPLLRSFLKMVFIDSWVHCDLHPGNVMVKTTDLGGGKEKRSIVFLDAGIATSLSPMDHQNLVDLFRAVLLDNGYEAGELMVERAQHERCSQVEGGIDAFARGVGELVSEFHDRRKAGLTLGAVHIGSLLSRVLDLCRIHGVEIHPSMASIVLSTLVLEGLGRSLHPDLNLIDFAIPFVLGRGKV
jgi:aarF domain-containing kinase